MDYIIPGFPVLHYLPEFAQSPCPLSQWCYPAISSSAASSPPALSLSQNQGFFQCVCCLHQTKYWSSVSASVLWMKSQGWFLSGLTSLITLQSKWVSIVFPSTTVWKHQFFNTQPSLRSNSHICTWLLEKQQLWLDRPLLAKLCRCFLICYLCLS